MRQARNESGYLIYLNPPSGPPLRMEKSVLEEMKISSARMAMDIGAGVRYSSQLA
uniref:Uncharacterized protein n=1 Tax=Anguilla anguilla TaxID=7936 RepID=A0A0E9XX66_ANGAN